jgi:uncharacterized membrane protein
MTPTSHDQSKKDLAGLLSRVMLGGVLVAAAVLLLGGVIYLSQHGGDPVGDHVFTGEPAALRHPLAIAQGALAVHPTAVIQLGVLLLLLNPILRIVLSLFGYARLKDRTYVVVCLILLAVLSFSFLGGRF